MTILGTTTSPILETPIRQMNEISRLREELKQLQQDYARDIESLRAELAQEKQYTETFENAFMEECFSKADVMMENERLGRLVDSLSDENDRLHTMLINMQWRVI